MISKYIAKVRCGHLRKVDGINDQACSKVAELEKVALKAVNKHDNLVDDHDKLITEHHTQVLPNFGGCGIKAMVA